MALSSLAFPAGDVLPWSLKAAEGKATVHESDSTEHRKRAAGPKGGPMKLGRQGGSPSEVSSTQKDGPPLCFFGAFGRHPVATKAPKQAMDADVAHRLWEVSERMTGVGYDALCPPDP